MNKLPLIAVCCCAAAAPVHAQVSLTLGQQAHGTLSYDDRRLDDGTHYDEYSFVARRGERMVVTLGSTDFDAFLYVGVRERGNFRELGTDDDGAGGTDSRVSFVAPEDGVYVVRANSLEPATGSYHVSVAREGGMGYGQRGPQSAGTKHSSAGGLQPAMNVSTGGYISTGQYVEGFLSASDPKLDGGEPFHLYRYTGRRGERVVITLASTEFDSYLVLGTAGGRHGVQSALARDDDGGGGRDARISFTLPYDGEYVIRVNPITGGTGRYRLRVDSGF